METNISDTCICIYKCINDEKNCECTNLTTAAPPHFLTMHDFRTFVGGSELCQVTGFLVVTNKTFTSTNEIGEIRTNISPSNV